MNKPSIDLLASYRSQQGQSVLFDHVMIVLMMLCLSIGFVQFGSRLFADWQGFYLVLVSLFIAIEAIATRNRTEDLDFHQKIFFHLSEFVAFAVIIKIIIYLIRGPGQLLNDIPLWQKDFIYAFFTGEYLLALFVTLLVWYSAHAFSVEIDHLYYRENDAVWDELGKLQNELREMRGKIASRVFLIGSLVTMLAVFTRLSINEILHGQPQPPIASNAPIANVLIYFILALALLSQMQFVLLRTRWMWQRLAIGSSLTRNWLKYGLIFFLALAVLVFFLPTNYSIGLFDTLRIALEYLMHGMSILFILFTLPFTLCASLFSRTTQPDTPRPIQPFPPTVTPAPPGQTFAWLEFLKSLAFWIVFLGVIYIALRYYLTQNTALWNAITRVPIFRWMMNIWQSMWGWIKGTNRQITGWVQSEVKRLRQQRTASSLQIPRRLFNLNRMDARQKIIFFYLSLVELGKERGLARKPSQTPYQYENEVNSAVPEVQTDLHGLTDTFLEARYSQHPVESPHAEQASRWWERIKAVLRGWKRA